MTETLTKKDYLNKQKYDQTTGELLVAERHEIRKGKTTLVASTHGASITSLTMDNREIVKPGKFSNALDDKDTWGNIHVCFPMIGIAADSTHPHIPKHGLIGEGSKWEYDPDSTTNKLIFTLQGKNTLAEAVGYPEDFVCKSIYSIEEDGSVDLRLIVNNIGSDPLPVAPGWHPYFDNPSGQLEDVSVIFPDTGVEITHSNGAMSLQQLDKTIETSLDGEALIVFKDGFKISINALDGFDGNDDDIVDIVMLIRNRQTIRERE